LPREVNKFGNIIDVKFEQPEKHPLSIEVSEIGRIIEVKSEQY
jgi:hypothetical protein